MRLSSLSIKGFKSFRNETVFNFTDNIIGIIGPNGSGKSNIIDAFRWVLGESKSRELRLESMSNVIFNGTSKVKPSNHAQVTLSFENTKNILPTEYNNVSISRLLYKDGTSEYRLNDVPCRRKDILSLFLDTGIGSNSYAIIELGMVDDILQNKDNARRLMFEQAAGISKYKSRKKETLNKLKNTNADLERVEDLLVEIEDNLKRIEKQARRTKRYYELKAEYKTKSTAFAKIEISQLEVDLFETASKIKNQRDEFVKLQAKTNTLDAVIQKQKKENLDSERVLSEKQKDLGLMLEAIRAKETEKGLINEKLSYLKNDNRRLEEELSAINPRIASIEVEIDTAHQNFEKELPQKAILEQEARDAQEALEIMRKAYHNEKESLERLVHEQKIRSNQILTLEREKATISGQIENVKSQIELLKEQIPDVQSEVKRLVSEQRLLQEKEAKASKTLKLQQETEEKQKGAIQASEQSLESIKSDLIQLRRKIDAKSNEYKLTKSMIENMEGYPDSIKFLTKNAKWSKSALLLSDVISCEEDYRMAIESYLEPFLNYFVVQNHKEARSGIKLLRDSQKGKANFLISEKKKKTKNITPSGVKAKPALDYVNFEKGYESLGPILLSNVFIAEEDQNDPSKIEEGVIVIIKNSGLILESHKMSGGSIGLFEGKKIGRKKGLEKMAKKLDRLEEEESNLRQLVDKQEYSLGQLKLDLQAVDVNTSRDRLSEVQRSLAALTAQFESVQAKKDDLDSRKAKSEGYLKELKQKLQGVEKKLENIESNELEALSGSEHMSVHIQKLNEDLQHCSNEYNQKNIALIQHNNKLQNLEQLLSIKRNQLKELREKNVDGIAALEKNRQESEKLLDREIHLVSVLEDEYEKKKQMTSDLNEVETRYFQSRSGLYDQEDDLKKLNHKLSQLQSVINDLKDSRQRIEFRIQGLLDRLSVEFKIEKQDIEVFELQEEHDREKLQEAIMKLSRRLENYGEINPMALEAFDEIKERFDDMNQQKEDIIEAQKSLEETMKEIETTATAHFLEAFDQVRTYFIEIFRDLFQDGDECDLILSDRENPLDATIDIIAKPKGKKPLSISMLSGGEKTLTATALLFSLYLLKPAPFCIFDEVDAPLDDINVSKFNRIIRRFSKESQFIIVTHNKLTMEALDTMYGIFMEEMGISSTSQVDFRTFKESGAMETLGA
ncbi:MAG: chromosome segregation protein SMC [Bacteroidia bacterium]|nr:chromosome segregation protein SMC [Bacteroidia bacterium]